MSISEPSTWEGRRLTVSWIAAPARPPRRSVTQASGVCFTGDGRIVLVAGPDGRWALPGGHLRPGETTEAAFVREVQEEACAAVQHLAYLGAQQVDDPEAAAGPRRTYQVRFWARVALEPFEPRFETRHRTQIAPAAFVETLAWRTARIAAALLEAALAEEARFRGCGGGRFREELGKESPVEKVNLAEKLRLFDKTWSPRIVGELNGQYVKLAKLKGEFLWHRHEAEDEMFLVVRGQLVIRFRDRDVILEAGEFLIVPRGVEHCPVAEEECHVLLFEPVTTAHTGDVKSERAVDRQEWI